MERILYVANFAAALGSGLVAGIFFAFSTFVMGALGLMACNHQERSNDSHHHRF